MDRKVIIALISFIAIGIRLVYGEVDDFCTISGNVKGLHETDFSSIFVKL